MSTTQIPKTLLFFPVEIGLAHSCRSLAIAEELQARGHRVIFALPKRKQTIIRNSPIPCIVLSSYLKDDINFLVSNITDLTREKAH